MEPALSATAVINTDVALPLASDFWRGALGMTWCGVNYTCELILSDILQFAE